MPLPARRLLQGVALLALSLAAAGLVLPRRWEVSREARYRVTPAVLLTSLDALPHAPRWASWEPASRGALSETSATPRGRWYDVEGHGRRKAALLVDPAPEGALLTWLDVLHTGYDPIAQLLALGRERRVGAQLERSLAGLRRALERP